MSIARKLKRLREQNIKRALEEEEELVKTLEKGQKWEGVQPSYQLTNTNNIKNPIAGVEYEKNLVNPATQKKIENLPQGSPQQIVESTRSEGANLKALEDLFLPSSSWEDFYGRPAVIIPADKTSVLEVSKVGGRDIQPFTNEAGAQFIDRFGEFMSMDGAAKNKQAHMQRVWEETGKQPVGIYTTMGDEGSHFSTMPIEVIGRYLKEGDMTPEGWNLLNTHMSQLKNTGEQKYIAENYPTLSGIDDMVEWSTSRERYMDEVAKAFREGRVDKMGKPEVASLGNRRKALSKLFASSKLRPEGAPAMDDIYAAITAPELQFTPHGYSGFRGLETKWVDDLDNLEAFPELHKSYTTLIPSERAFQMEGRMLPWQIMFKDMIEPRKWKKSDADIYRSIQTSGGKDDYQMIDDDFLRRVEEYEKMMTNLLGIGKF